MRFFVIAFHWFDTEIVSECIKSIQIGGMLRFDCILSIVMLSQTVHSPSYSAYFIFYTLKSIIKTTLLPAVRM